MKIPKTSEICRDDTKRRQAIRATERKQGLNGIDYLDVSEDQRTLTVFFLLKAPEQELKTGNVRIDGGRRVRNIKVLEVTFCRNEDPERDDCMKVKVDKPGDFSTYTLCLVEADQYGRPTETLLNKFDSRYACVDFSFKANCPSDLDCQPVDTCPPRKLVEPEINYLAKDYASFRQLILDRLSLIMPGWQERHIPDFGITLVEILAYVGDYLSYYQDAVATEAYLETARQRISVRRHVRLVDYQMHEGCNARTWLFVETFVKTSDVVSLDPQDIYFITGQNNALTVSSTMLSDTKVQQLPSTDYEVFEPLLVDPQQTIQLYEAHNEIPFYTWDEQECCLPRGATIATLRGELVSVSSPGVETRQQQKPSEDVPPSTGQSSTRKGKKQQEPPKASSDAPEQGTEPEHKLHLKVGDALIFEEVLGPKTGVQEDADPTHRHAVRLTRVERGVDTLNNILVVEIEWGVEDALPFPLCLSTIGPPDLECQLLENISVARGNVILVDYGQTREEDLDPVPTERTIARCDECTGGVGDTEVIPGLFRPRLQQAPMTFSESLVVDAPFFQPTIPDPDKPVTLTSATSLLPQDPRKTLPWIKLTSTPPLVDIVPSTGDEEEEEDEETEAESEQTTQSNTTEWFVRRDLLESESDAYDFVVEMDNEGFASLRFGDGQLGRVPEAGTKFHAKYRFKNGQAGNVGAESITHIVFRSTLISGVTLQPRNPFAVHGGTDPEPLPEVKLFAPHFFRSSKNLQRAITADDYARLAERYPGVQRAAATLRWIGSWYEALVVIDPLGTEEADQALLDGVTAYLEQYRRMGHDLLVVPAHYVSLDIAMTICVQPHFLRGHVKAALLDLFSNRVLPNGKLGFFHPDNLTFGQGIAVSKLVATAQAVPGVQSVTITKLERLFEGPNNELQQEFLALRLQEIARLDNDPSFPEHGKLVFTMEGGR